MCCAAAFFVRRRRRRHLLIPKSNYLALGLSQKMIQNTPNPVLHGEGLSLIPYAFSVAQSRNASWKYLASPSAQNYPNISTNSPSFFCFYRISFFPFCPVLLRRNYASRTESICRRSQIPGSIASCSSIKGSPKEDLIV